MSSFKEKLGRLVQTEIHASTSSRNKTCITEAKRNTAPRAGKSRTALRVDMHGG